MNLFIAFLLPVFAGTAFVRWFAGGPEEMPFTDALVYGLGLGTGFLTYEMFLLGIAGLPFSLPLYSALLLIFGAFFVFLSFRQSRSLERPPRPRGEKISGVWLWVTVFLSLWIFIKVLFVLYEAFNRPIYAFDAMFNWAVGAKLFFYSGGIISDPANEHFLGKGYRAFLGHPLHVPLLETWVSLWLGRFDEIYAKTPSFLYFVGLLGLFFHAVRRESNLSYAVAAVFFFAGLPLLTYHGYIAYADLTLSFYALAGTITFWRFMKTGSTRYLMLSGMLFAMGMFVKNEGVIFAGAAFTALLLFLIMEKKPVIKNLAFFVAPIVVLTGPWLFFKAFHGLGYGHTGHESGMKWLSDPKFGGDVPRGVHWEVIPAALSEVFLKANFNIIFPFWIFMTFAGFKIILRSEIKYIYLIILQVMGVFIFIYLTLEVTAVTESTGINRNILTYIPVLFFSSLVVLFRVLSARRGSERDHPSS